MNWRKRNKMKKETKKEVKKEVKKELIFKLKCLLDKNGNKYLIDGKSEQIKFVNIIVFDNDTWGKYSLRGFKVGKEYDIQVSGYKIENNRIALFVKNELVELLP